MNVREWVDAAPAGVVAISMTPEGLRELLSSAGEIAEGTPTQVARILGRSGKYWRKMAVAGKIGGAYQEESGRWHLPLSACRAHLLEKQSKATAKGWVPRGPRKKASTAQAGAAGSAGVQARPILVGGSATVEGAANSVAQSQTPRLAVGRRAHGR